MYWLSTTCNLGACNGSEGSNLESEECHGPLWRPGATVSSTNLRSDSTFCDAALSGRVCDAAEQEVFQIHIHLLHTKVPLKSTIINIASHFQKYSWQYDLVIAPKLSPNHMISLIFVTLIKSVTNNHDQCPLRYVLLDLLPHASRGEMIMIDRNTE